MKIINIISGMILVAMGMLLGYIDFYIVSIYYAVSQWIAGMINAPEAVAILLTIIMIIITSGIVIFLAAFCIYLVCTGIMKIFDN